MSVIYKMTEKQKIPEWLRETLLDEVEQLDDEEDNNEN